MPSRYRKDLFPWKRLGVPVLIAMRNWDGYGGVLHILSKSIDLSKFRVLLERHAAPLNTALG